MKDYRLLIFDWDGTLADSTGHIVEAVHQAAGQLSLPKQASQFIRQGIGLNFEQQMQRLYPGQDFDYRDFREVFDQHYQALSSTKPPFFDQALELLKHLKDQGYQMAIATGKSKVGLEAVLDRYALSDLFEMWCCGDQYPSKPDPAMLEAILDALAIPSEQSLMVGDSIYDMQAAKAAGMDALAVLTGINTASELMHHDPIGCAASVRYLPWFLG